MMAEEGRLVDHNNPDRPESRFEPSIEYINKVPDIIGLVSVTQAVDDEGGTSHFWYGF